MPQPHVTVLEQNLNLAVALRLTPKFLAFPSTHHIISLALAALLCTSPAV
jgi:hypothetical protein